MKVNRIDTGKIKGDKLNVYFIGDFHVGSKDCNIDKIKEDIATIKGDKNALAIIMGDTCNCGLRNSVGAGSFDDLITPARQMEDVIEMLMPIKDKIVGVHNGNHSNRVYNETSLIPEKMIAKDLGVPYLGDTCFHHMRFKNQTYILFTAHGSTGSSSVGGSLNSCMKYRGFAQADLYAMGHTHNLSTYAQIVYEIDRKDKTLTQKKKHYLLSGGYLEWKGSYAEQKNYAPLKLGCAMATFNGKEYDIEVKI